MAELGMGTPSDDDGESSGPTLQEITGVEQEASDVLEKARALSEKVTKAIQNYKDAESNCADATDKNTKESVNLRVFFPSYTMCNTHPLNF